MPYGAVPDEPLPSYDDAWLLKLMANHEPLPPMPMTECLAVLARAIIELQKKSESKPRPKGGKK